MLIVALSGLATTAACGTAYDGAIDDPVPVPDASAEDVARPNLPETSVADASEAPDAADAADVVRAKETKTFVVPGETSFVVPAGITSLSVDAWGAGGGGSLGGVGGGGSFVTATFSVMPLTSVVILLLGSSGRSKGTASLC